MLVLFALITTGLVSLVDCRESVTRETVNVAIGSTVTFNCSTDSPSRVRWNWYNGSMDVTNTTQFIKLYNGWRMADNFGQRHSVYNDNATGLSQLTINNVQQQNMGVYQCLKPGDSNGPEFLLTVHASSLSTQLATTAIKISSLPLTTVGYLSTDATTSQNNYSSHTIYILIAATSSSALITVMLAALWTFHRSRHSGGVRKSSSQPDVLPQPSVHSSSSADQPVGSGVEMRDLRRNPEDPVPEPPDGHGRTDVVLTVVPTELDRAGSVPYLYTECIGSEYDLSQSALVYAELAASQRRRGQSQSADSNFIYASINHIKKAKRKKTKRKK